MVQYKLTYFNIKGRGEPIRIIFAYLGVPYEDHRIELKDWPQWKSKYPWGQVPVLEVDGVTLCQSNAIGRFLSRRYGLVGTTEMEGAMCDEYIDVINDLKAEWKKFARQDEEKKAAGKIEFVDIHAPKYLNKLSALKESNEGSLWLVGQSITWADIVVAATLEMLEEAVNPTFLDAYPVIKALKQRVYSIPKIKEYIDRRPQVPPERSQ